MTLFIPKKHEEFFDAIRNGDIDSLKQIIAERSVDPNVKTLMQNNGIHVAAEHNQTALIPLLVDFGTDINGLNWQEQAPIAVGAGHGQREAVQELLRLKADPDARGPAMRTALMRAADKGHDFIVQDLIEAKADIHAIAGLGDGQRNAVNFAVEERHYGTAKILSDAGVSHEFLNRHQIAAAGLAPAAPSGPRP